MSALPPGYGTMKYDAYLNRAKEGGGPRREVPPQDKDWAKVWVWRARGYTYPFIAKKLGISEGIVQKWAQSPRFKAGLGLAQKAWDLAAIRREVTGIEGGVEPAEGGRATAQGPAEDLTQVLGGG